MTTDTGAIVQRVVWVEQAPDEAERDAKRAAEVRAEWRRKLAEGRAKPTKQEG